MSEFFRVIAVLASSAERPEGDPGQVLTLHVPLISDGQLDAEGAANAGGRVSVELAIPGKILWASPLVRIDDCWVVHPAGGEEGPSWRVDVRALRPGEYLTLYPENEREQGYRVVNVEPG